VIFKDKPPVGYSTGGFFWTGDNGSRRSWARQSSGALRCHIPKSGGSGDGFHLEAVLQTFRVKMSASERMATIKICIHPWFKTHHLDVCKAGTFAERMTFFELAFR